MLFQDQNITYQYDPLRALFQAEDERAVCYGHGKMRCSWMTCFVHEASAYDKA
jgi:hypothetical protein